MIFQGCLIGGLSISAFGYYFVAGIGEGFHNIQADQGFILSYQHFR